MLFYGDDLGLITERTKELAAKVSEKDSFRLVTIGTEEIDRFAEEYDAISFFGGRRVIVLRDATDAVLAPLKTALEAIDAQDKEAPLVLIEGGSLSSKSRLRKYAEKAPKIAAIGCYPPTGQEISDWVRRELAREKISLTKDAEIWLSTHMEGDRALLRSEIEKFCLYAHPNVPLDKEDLQDITGDTASADMGEAIQWAFAGNYPKADAAFRRALTEGQHPIAYARGVFYQLRRLEKARMSVEAGISPAQAVAALRPPIFWRDRDKFTAAVKGWSLPALQNAGKITLQLEQACKQSGPPAELLAWRHLAWLSKKHR
ncbi:dna polymerase iii subunit delta [Lasius niger]|uniref:DNA polymerase III subunit delta n=1 Tax=Lasius niger TaxID=67767 RepID=A0A0J7KNR6_LASNI|nr:dna polymerase iii subunit delta [Lasius niger]